MLREYEDGTIPLAVLGGPVDDYVIEGVLGAREPDPMAGRRLGDVARERGVHPVECLFDLSLESDLQTSFLTQSATSDDPEHVAELLSSPYVVAGVSDGGAHAKFTVGGAYTTDLLEWLVRDESQISVEDAHYKLAWLPARLAGLRRRGALLEGMAADVLVYDPARIRRAPDWRKVEVAHDQPAGEWRLVQKAEGYHWTLVNGEITFDGATCTGATPGRLLRDA
jgi:N-acyl-D-aspartate/D-glutamate deacylase